MIRTSNTSRIRRILIAGFGAAAAFGLAACGTPEVAQDSLEQQIHQQLTEEIGQEPDEIRCAGPLPGEENASVDCALRAGDEWLPIEVKTTEVDGSDIYFDAQVGETTIAEPDF